jgi:hypothetical protein
MTNKEFLEMLGREFPEAITSLRMRWEENLKSHGTDTWKRLSAQDHLSHFSGHVSQLQYEKQMEDNGAAMTWRGIMYLQTRNGHKAS